MLQLRYDTPSAWSQLVADNLSEFLQDHAANERKVSYSAIQLVAHHPDKKELVDAMVEVAQEEMDHFRQVYDLLKARGVPLAKDIPDPYMTTMFRALRRPDVKDYLLDRLVLFSVVEARGCERFALAAEAMPTAELKAFYEELVRSESRHHALYLRLAKVYFPEAEVQERLEHILDLEARTMAALPLRPSLH